MIHKYKMNDLNIVIDVNSGAIHSVTNPVYDILTYFENQYKKANISNINREDLKSEYQNIYSLGDIEESIEDIEYLIEEELLFSKDIHQEAVPTIENRNPVVKALCIHIAHDCNLKCKYCFAEEGEYHGKREMMSLSVGKSAIDFLIKSSGTRKNLEIDFFGGEPLMNFNVVKGIVEYARGLEKQYNKNFRFTMTTNGMLLTDEISNYINENMSNAVLSLDGRKEINDLMRPTRNNKGSYDIILDKYKNLVDNRGDKDYYVRGTFTANNLDFSKDILHMADCGFKNLSVEPVVADNTEQYAIKEEHLEQIYEEYEVLANEIIKRNGTDKEFLFFHFMVDLTGGPCIYKRLTGCGAGTEYLAVAPSGDLYPCHQFVGKEEFLLGNVLNSEKTVVNEEVPETFSKVNVYTKSACQNCWGKYYCSGGCLANSHEYMEDLNTPYSLGCKLQLKRLECAIMIKVAEMYEN